MAEQYITSISNENNGTDVYAYTFSSEAALEEAVRNNRLGSASKNYKNWIACVTSTNEKADYTIGVNKMQIYADCKNSDGTIKTDRIFYGSTYVLDTDTDVFDWADGEAMKWADRQGIRYLNTIRGTATGNDFVWMD